jgi:hypothetical protein
VVTTQVAVIGTFRLPGLSFLRRHLNACIAKLNKKDEDVFTATIFVPMHDLGYHYSLFQYAAVTYPQN